MSDHIARDGAFKTEVSFCFLNEEGDQAWAKYEFPPGRLLTTQDLRDAVTAIRDSGVIPSGFILLENRHLFVNILLDKGEDFAIPGPQDFALDIGSSGG